jgi:POT family proton-dependent oligopeptide transporter
MASSSADQIRRARGSGPPSRHPRGLVFLFATQMWERFAFYGIAALINLYMVTYLLVPDRAEGVLGLGPLRSAIESASGPLAVEPLAAQIAGLYLALSALALIIGGLIADRMLGIRRTAIIGAALLAGGAFMLMLESLFLPALVLLAAGGGVFQPSIASEVGRLYAAGDPRRDRGYLIFYAGVGVGALLGPAICSELGEAWGWRYGFALAGLGMLTAFAVYLMAVPALAPEEATPRQRQSDPTQWRALALLLVLLVPLMLFWAAYGQKTGAIALWADDHTDRTINLFIWHGEIPVAWFQSLNPLMIVAFTPLLLSLWSRQRGGETPTLAKMGVGAFCVALAYLIMAGAAFAAAGDEASWWWLAAYFAAITIGELYIAPIGLSLVSKAAPPRMLALTMGLWLAAPHVGRLTSPWLGGVSSGTFLLPAATAALAGILIFAYAWLLRRLMK